MSKETADGLKTISTTFLRDYDYLHEGCMRSGVLIWSQDGEEIGRIDLRVDMTPSVPKITFIYKVRISGDEWTPMEYTFSLLSIPCHYGGKRWYFQCGLHHEGVFCGRRVMKLYQIGEHFGCRHCGRLSYESRNENKRMRSGDFYALKQEFRADEYYTTHVKRAHYRGKPTRQYRRFLRLLGEL